MPGISVSKICIPFSGGGGVNWATHKTYIAFVWDGPHDTHEHAYGIFAEYGLIPSFAITTDGLTAPEIARYQGYATAGCSIISHSDTWYAMNNPATVTYAQVKASMLQSKADLAAIGITAKGWGTPGSALDPTFFPILDGKYEYGFTGLNGGKYDESVHPLKMARLGVEGAVHTGGVASVKTSIDNAITNQDLLILYSHEQPSGYLDGGVPYVSDAQLREILAYIKAKVDAHECRFGACDTAVETYYSYGETYSAAVDGDPSALVITELLNGDRVLNWTIGSTNHNGHIIERSTDGVNYSDIGSVTGITANFTDTAVVETVYYRVRAYKGTLYSNYSNVVNYTIIQNFLLTSTGTGDGVSTIKLTVSENITITLGANAKFYSDAGGTLDESDEWTVTSGAERTRYLKCTTGTALFIVPNKNKIIQWRDWTSAANAASLSGDISKLRTLTYIYCVGNNTLSGNISNLTALTYIHLTGTNTLSGSVAALTGLTRLNVTGSNTLSGSVAALTDLTYLACTGSNTLSGSVAALTDLTYLACTGSNTLSGSIAALTSLGSISVIGNNTLTGSIAALTSLTYLDCRGSNTISGDLNLIVSDLTYLLLEPCAMTDYTSGATWGNAIIKINPSEGYGYSETEIDNILIDMAASAALISKTITLQGANAVRTSASDAAVATLQGAGRTCTLYLNT